MKLGLGAFVCMVAACGGSHANRQTDPPKGKTPPPAVPSVQLTQLADPGEVLLDRERSVWLLEGRLLADADATLHADAATAALGSPETRAAQVAEGKVRAYLREHRSAEARDLARTLVAAFSKPTRTLLDAAAAAEQVSAEDIFLDYLTYDGLYDLATMRYGYDRLATGDYAEGSAERALAESFFAGTSARPSLASGISVVAEDKWSLELSVFGARVRDEVTKSSIVSTATVGRVGVVEWVSSYESLRIAGRGAAADKTEETLDQEDGKYLISYAVEIDEYLTWGAQEPWATMLSLLPVDEAADLYAGVVARGGLEGTVETPSLDTLPTSGALADGVTAKVIDARAAAKIAGKASRAGKFLIVTVELTSKAKAETRAPASWFQLVAGNTMHAELGVIRPGWGPTILAAAPSGARMLALPYTAVPAKGKLKLTLVFDVPADVGKAALLVGAAGTALKVEAK